jgi:23S rRNA pseudouridine1911/1915/1917 synthase
VARVQSRDLDPEARTADSRLRIVVGAAEADLRLDELIAQRLAVGRRAAIRLAARSLRNGRPARKGDRVAEGDEIAVPSATAFPQPSLAADEDRNPRILRLTPEVAVVGKPLGLATVGLLGGAQASLAAWVARELPECAAVGARGECGLVHRLDAGTSGLLLAARTDRAYRALRSQFTRHAVEKTYLAIVEGSPATPLRIDVDVGQHHRSRRRMRAVTDRSPGAARYVRRPAATVVEVIETLGRASLVRATTSTGARHQVRVHLAYAGHPLVGDVRYGGRAEAGWCGHLLHAESLRWVDPVSGEVALDRLELPHRWSEMRRRLAALC